MKVLIVEDEKNSLSAYKLALKAKEHEVISAQTAENAIKEYEKYSKDIEKIENKFPFDVVVLDYKLPDSDGISVANEILKINPLQRIIFASAYIKELIESNSGSLSSYYKQIEYLWKPFDIDNLLEKVEFQQLAEELNEFGIKTNPITISRNFPEIMEILNGLTKVEEKYLMDFADSR